MTKSVAIAVLSLIAFIIYAAPGQSEPQVDSMTRSTFQAATSALHQALRSNDADAFFTHVADDVVLMPPGEAPVHGKAAMRAWYAGFLSQFRTSSLTLAEQEVFVGDGWAVELGSYEWGLKAVTGGDSIIDRGSYMQVWKRQPGGQWQFAREIWNSSVPPAAPAEK